MPQACGNCLYQGKIDATSQGIEILCLFHTGQRHKDSYKCDNYTEYLQLSLPERIKLATEARNHIETQKRYQETSGIAVEANKIAIRSDVRGWVVGIGGLVIGIISIGVSVYFGLQNKELKGIQQNVYNYAQSIQQNNYYYNLPTTIKDNVDKIAAATGDVVRVRGFGDKK